MPMLHSHISFPQTVSSPDNLRINSNPKFEHSVLVSDDLCAAIQVKLATRFHVRSVEQNRCLVQCHAYITDCRGTVITSPDNIESIHCDTVFALVDEYSYLPFESSEHDTNLELITEAELSSGILELRISSRLRAMEKETDNSFSDQDMVKANAYEILQTIMKYSTDWMVIKDLDHRFAMVTDRFLNANNKDASDIVGKNDLEIGTAEKLVLGDAENDWPGYWHDDDRVIASQQADETEHMLIEENALEQKHEHVARVPIKNKDGDVIALMVCVTQVTTSKFNGDTVSSLASRQNIVQPPIIKQLDNDRNKAEALNQQTQTAIKRKNNFIATASHDLRQPLHAIGLFIESLEKKIDDSKQRAILSKMKQSTKDLSALLNSILEISKLDAEAVPVNKSHFPIARILESIEDEFENDAIKKSINLNINSCKAVVHTDPLLLSRILKNLVSNAVKYTNAGSVNLITEVDKNDLIIRVKDSGPGIPKEQYQTVFLEYQQLHDQNEQPNFGQGLGLSIVKRLVELLKLDITLESEMGHGAEFAVKVPLGDSHQDQRTDCNRADNKAFDAFKLMVIDDNATVLEAMEEMLSSMNCDAYPAYDIPEALEIINELEELPDLLIVDYQLANGVTGDTAIAQIRKAAKKSIPAIIVTGNTSSTLVRKAAESAFRVLNKPVNPDILLSTINSAVKEHQREPA